MDNNISKILDECLERIKNGESIDACLARYAHQRDRIEPLLRTALEIHAVPKTDPSDEFVEELGKRLLARHHQQAAPGRVRTGVSAWPAKVAQLCQNLTGAVVSRKRAAISTALTFVLVVVVCFAAFNFLMQTPASASTCTLSVLSGSVEVREPDSPDWEQGTEGMVLTAGARAKTSLESHALLTFAEGSTIKLQPDTEVEIKQLKVDSGSTSTIVLKQWKGITWSHVKTISEPASYYEIETPSASAVAQGTLFITEVIDAGITRVINTEGEVKVHAQGEEVVLPAKKQIEIKAGEKPSQVIETPAPKSSISVMIGAPAVVSVIDPTGSSVGRLPGDFSFNQILGGTYSLTDDGTSMVTIPHPINGKYLVALRYDTDGEARLEVEGLSNGKVAFEYSGMYQGTVESGWLIELRVNVANDTIIDGEVVSIASLGTEMPEKIVKVKPAKDKDKSQDSEEKQDKDKGQDSEEKQEQENKQDKEEKQDEDKGQDGEEEQDKDKGQDSEEEQDQENKQDKEEKQDKDKNQDKEEKQDKDKNNTGNSDKDKDQDKDKEKDKDK